MSKIVISAAASHIAEAATISLLKGRFEAKTARISYNVSTGHPSSDKAENYPLVLEGFIGSSPVEVYVYSVTAGYAGTGPHTMVDILKAAGFTFDESDILTKKFADSTGQITLTYKR